MSGKGLGFAYQAIFTFSVTENERCGDGLGINDYDSVAQVPSGFLPNDPACHGIRLLLSGFGPLDPSNTGCWRDG
jgi:hypothetical protein